MIKSLTGAFFLLIIVGVMPMKLAYAVGSLNLKLPFYADRVSFLSDTSYIYVQGEVPKNRNWRSLGIKKDKESQVIFQFLNSMDKVDQTQFLTLVDKENFSSSEVDPTFYFEQFSQSWQDMTNPTLFAILRFDDIVVLVLEARYGGSKIHPVASFQWTSKDKFSLIVDDKSNQHQLLLLWCAQLVKSTLPFVVTTEIKEATPNRLTYTFIKPDVAYRRSPSMKIYFDMSDDLVVYQVNNFLNDLQKDLDIKAPVSRQKYFAKLKPYHSDVSFDYLASALTDTQKASEYVKQLQGYVATKVIQLDNVLVVYGVSEVTGSPMLLYLHKGKKINQIVNLGRVTALDNLLLNSTLIQRMIK